MTQLVYHVACERCGASLDIPTDKPFVVCGHCRNHQFLPFSLSGENHEQWVSYSRFFLQDATNALAQLQARIVEISKKDRQVNLAMDAMNEAFAKTMQSKDPVVDCKIIFACAKEYSALLEAHADYPREHMHMSATGHARLMVRAAVDSGALMWGTEISE